MTYQSPLAFSSRKCLCLFAVGDEGRSMSKPQLATPCVNAALLHKYIGRNVHLVGRISSINQREGFFTLESTDNQTVRVIASQPSRFPMNAVIDVVGTVNSDLSVREMDHEMYNSEFHFQNWDAVVNFMQKYPEPFEVFPTLSLSLWIEFVNH